MYYCILIYLPFRVSWKRMKTHSIRPALTVKVVVASVRGTLLSQTSSCSFVNYFADCSMSKRALYFVSILCVWQLRGVSAQWQDKP